MCYKMTSVMGTTGAREQRFDSLCSWSLGVTTGGWGLVVTTGGGWELVGDNRGG